MRIGSVENPVTIAAYGLFGAVFGGIGLFLVWQNPVAGLVFGGFGALFLFGAVHSYLGAMRFGDVALEVREPVVPGGRLVARLDCPGGAGGASTIHAEVNCKKVEWVRAGGKRHLSETAIWSAKRSFPLRAAAKGAHCDIDFDLPKDAPLSEGGSTETRSMPGIYWELQVESEDLPGVDLMRGFRFPVVAGTPPPSDLLRPSVPRVYSPEKAARAEEGKKRYLEASKAAVYALMVGGAALFAYMYWGQPSGRGMSRAFFAVIAATMLVYWVASYRNWLRDKVDDPDTPPLTGMFLWHGIVLAIAGWQLLLT